MIMQLSQISWDYPCKPICSFLFWLKYKKLNPICSSDSFSLYEHSRKCVQINRIMQLLIIAKIIAYNP
jgi:hypothetical protein